MGNLIKTEWYKLRKDRVFFVLTLLLVAVAFLMPLELVFTEQGVPNFGENEFFMGHVLSINIEIIMRTVPCILAGFFISSEYSMGTMKSIVSSGNSRARIYFAKLMIFSVGTIIISLVLPIVMTGVSAIYVGGSVVPEGIYFLQIVGLISLYAAAFASIMMFFAILFTDSGKTIGFLFFFFLLFNEILEMLSSRISFFEHIINNSVFSLLFQIYHIGQLESNEVLGIVTVPVVTFVVFAVLGSIIFMKKEIK